MKLSLGMTEDEVITAIDKPSARRGAIVDRYGKQIEVWEYSEYKSDDDAFRGRPTLYWLTFYDGKLVRWGEAGDWRQPRIYGAPFEQYEPPKKTEASLGTGFFITKEGHILTNCHVVEGADEVSIRLSDGQIVSAKLFLRDKVNDIAILVCERPTPSLTPDVPQYKELSLGDSAEVKLGTKVFVVGHPLGDVLGKKPQICEGIVSALTGIEDDPRVFQITVPIQPGNSGSPLLNVYGEVIGVVLATLDARYIYSKTRTLPQNVNFAVKSNYARNLLEMMPSAKFKELEEKQHKPVKSAESIAAAVQNAIVLIQTAE